MVGRRHVGSGHRRERCLALSVEATEQLIPIYRHQGCSSVIFLRLTSPSASCSSRVLNQTRLSQTCPFSPFPNSYISTSASDYAPLPRVRVNPVLLPLHLISNLPSITRRSTNGSLPSQSFWGKFKPRGGKDSDRNGQMALSRQRLLTLAYGDMETIRMASLPLQPPL